MVSLKVTVHLEQCFQFPVCNSVNKHQIPTNLSINGMESLRNYLNDDEKIV